MLNKLKDRAKNKKGFTMVELIVVIVIILILGATLTPNIYKYIEQARAANVKSDAAALMTEVQAYIAEEVANASTKLTNTELATKVTTKYPASSGLKAFEANSDYSIKKFQYTNTAYTALYNYDINTKKGTWTVYKGDSTNGGDKIWG